MILLSLINSSQLDSIITGKLDKKDLENRIVGWMPYKVRGLSSYVSLFSL